MEKQQIRIGKEIVYREDDYDVYDVNAFLPDGISIARAYVLSVASDRITSGLLAEANNTSTTVYDTMLAARYAVKKGILAKGPIAGIMWASTDGDYRRQGVFTALLSYITKEFGDSVVLRFAPTIPESLLELPEDIEYLNARFQHNADNLENKGWKIIPSDVAKYSNNEFAAKTLD